MPISPANFVVPVAMPAELSRLRQQCQRVWRLRVGQFWITPFTNEDTFVNPPVLTATQITLFLLGAGIGTADASGRVPYPSIRGVQLMLEEIPMEIPAARNADAASFICDIVSANGSSYKVCFQLRRGMK